MKTKNHIKLNKGVNKNLRGIGKLGWTESGRTLSTQKRLMATFTDENAFEKRKKRNTIKKKCPLCKKNAKVVKGKYITHSWGWFKQSMRHSDYYVCSNSHKEIV